VTPKTSSTLLNTHAQPRAALRGREFAAVALVGEGQEGQEGGVVECHDSAAIDDRCDRERQIPSRLIALLVIGDACFAQSVANGPHQFPEQAQLPFRIAIGIERQVHPGASLMCCVCQASPG